MFLITTTKTQTRSSDAKKDKKREEGVRKREGRVGEKERGKRR